MLTASTLLLALLAGPANGGASVPPVVQDAGDALLAEHQALVDEYDNALLAWKKEIRAKRRAKDDSWRELRNTPPVRAFWPRFEALAEAGEGRALHWLAQQTDEAINSREETATKKRELYLRLVSKHAGEAWLAEGLAGLPRERRFLGEDGVKAVLTAAGEREDAHPEVAACALYVLAAELGGRKATAEDLARADELYVKVHTEYPETKAGRASEQTVFELRHLRPGKPAPDFTAVDADGAQFKLSDYKGKVVLVDFWGFW